MHVMCKNIQRKELIIILYMEETIFYLNTISLMMLMKECIKIRSLFVI